MKVLIVGNGGREHALAWKLKQSPKVTDIFIAPGNAGTETLGTNLPIAATDLPALAAAARQYRIGLTVVGPEAPLAAGIVDHFEGMGLPVFGPSKAASQLESSKTFAKTLMRRYGIPCALGASFDSHVAAVEFVKSQPAPLVIKADGLAAGKGVVVAGTKESALQALDDFMAKKTLGAAGDRVIIEECLDGKEVSLLAVTDGTTVLPMAPACDYKRVYDSDQGPNTGGMGSYSPPGFFSARDIEEVRLAVLEPVVQAMRMEGMPYKGVLYAGLMVTSDGIKVLEFNVRFGDPETQVILPRLETDLLDIMLASIDGSMHGLDLRWSPDACVGVVVASAGYPGSYETGHPISGLDNLNDSVAVFHAGTGKEDGRIVTSGGRVMAVTARGGTLEEARARVYDNLRRIHFEGCHYRTDIAAPGSR